MKTFSFFIFIFIFAYLLSNFENTVSSKEPLWPCCNNIDPQTEPTIQTLGFKCGGGQDIIISRSCCLEKWFMYGPYPGENTPCSCEGGDK